MTFDTPIPFVDHLGFRVLKRDAGESELEFDLREEFTNSWSVAHGGVIMTLLDVAMAQAARSPNQPGHPTSPGVVTIEMKTTFVRPGVGRLAGRGKLLHRTASMAFCEGRVLDSAGELVAHSTGTFKYLKGLATGGRKIQRPDASD